jgi:hypothetical protein
LANFTLAWHAAFSAVLRGFPDKRLVPMRDFVLSAHSPERSEAHRHKENSRQQNGFAAGRLGKLAKVELSSSLANLGAL